MYSVIFNLFYAFYKEILPLIDSSAGGNSNTGPTARRFFGEYEITSRILNCPQESVDINNDILEGLPYRSPLWKWPLLKGYNGVFNGKWTYQQNISKKALSDGIFANLRPLSNSYVEKVYI